MGDVVAFNPKTPRAPGEATWGMARAHILAGGRARRDCWWDSWLVASKVANGVFAWFWNSPHPQLVREVKDPTYSPWGPDQDACDWVLE